MSPAVIGVSLKAFDEFSEPLNKFVRATQDTFEKVEGEARSWSEQIEDVFSNLWKSIENIYEEYFSRIGEYLIEVGKIAAGWVGVLTGASIALGGLLTGNGVLAFAGAVAAVASAALALSGAFGLIGKLWEDFITPIVDLGEASFNRIADAIGSVVSAAGDLFTSVFETWKPLLKDFQNDLATFHARNKKAIEDYGKSENISEFRENLHALLTDIQGFENRVSKALDSYPAGSEMRTAIQGILEDLAKLKKEVDTGIINLLPPPPPIKREIEQLGREVNEGLRIISEGSLEELKNWVRKYREAAQTILDNEPLHEDVKSVIESVLKMSKQTSDALKKTRPQYVAATGDVKELALMMIDAESASGVLGAAIVNAAQGVGRTFVPAMNNAKDATEGVGAAVASMALDTKQATIDTGGFLTRIAQQMQQTADAAKDAGEETGKIWRQQASEVSRTLNDMSGAFSAAADFAGVFDDVWAQALNNVASNISKVAQGLSNLTSENPIQQISGIFQIASGIGSFIGGLFGGGGESSAERQRRLQEQQRKWQEETNRLMGEFVEELKELVSAQAGAIKWTDELNDLYVKLRSRTKDFAEAQTILKDAIDQAKDAVDDAVSTLAEMPMVFYDMFISIDDMRRGIADLKADMRDTAGAMRDLGEELIFVVDGVKLTGEAAMDAINAAIAASSPEGKISDLEIQIGAGGTTATEQKGRNRFQRLRDQRITLGEEREILGQAGNEQTRLLIKQLIAQHNSLIEAKFRLEVQKDTRKATRESRKELRQNLPKMKEKLAALENFYEEFGSKWGNDVVSWLGRIHDKMPEPESGGDGFATGGEILWRGPASGYDARVRLHGEELMTITPQNRIGQGGDTIFNIVINADNPEGFRAWMRNGGDRELAEMVERARAFGGARSVRGM